MASVIYALIAAPTYTGLAIGAAPLTVSGSMIILFALDYAVIGLGKLTTAVCRIASNCMRAVLKPLKLRE